MQDLPRPTSSAVFSGTPLFSGEAKQCLAAGGTVAQAWQKALQSDVRSGLQSVTGDFALGMQLPDGRVVLAVDRFAVRSLCYREVQGQLQFAATLDGLVEDGVEIDPQAIFDYLYFHVIPSPRTIYRGVYRLPPGHFAVFERGRLTVAPYWTPRFEEDSNPRPFQELKDEFRAIVQSAVERELDVQRPACFLSGGTDSSTVAGMATLVSDRKVDTYSIGFDAQGYDEMEFARIAARRFDTRHHEYYVTPADLVQHIPTVAAHYDQPFGNSSALPAYCCSKLAHDDGITKLLAGDGGDELFGGNTRYAKQKLFGWYDSVPPALRRAIAAPAAGNALVSKLPLVRKAASYVTQAKVPMPDRMMTYNLLFHLGVDDVLTPQMLRQVDLPGQEQQQRDVWQEVSEASLVNRMLAFDWRYTLAECDLPKVVGTTALAGVGVGFPMLDHQLLEFSLKLPTSYKLKGFKLRWFFKEALRGFLPDEIIAKKKHGFGLPFGVWANSDPALKALATDSLNGLARRGVIRSEFAQALLSRLLPEHPGYYGEMVWILTMLEPWLAAKAPRFVVRD